jgi:hypothetical protein
VENATLGSQEGKGISADWFDTQFGFEDFDVGLRCAEKPGGEAFWVLLGEDFGKVVVGHFDCGSY